MKRLLLLGVILFFSTLVFAEDQYQIAGASISFQEGFFGIGGSYIIQREDNLRLGGTLSFAFSTDDYLLFDIYSSEFAIGLGGMIGYNFGQIFSDLGISVGYGRVTAKERGFWLFQNSPVIRSGDTLFSGFTFEISPSVGTHINKGNMTVIPRIAMPFSWFRYSSSENLNREISAELSYLVGGVAFIDLIDDISLNIFQFSLQPGLSFLINSFYFGLSMNIPIRINTEMEISFIDNSSLTETSSGDRNISVGISFGLRF
ncbi:MAG: hypothetical protein FWD82_05880 [Defluviitaleaceae bacterium]|nr:hypothetical protein [Defluviitaleaceae bacterium]